MITAALPFRLTRPLVFLDTETTGLSPQRDRIIELSLEIYRPDADEPQKRTRRFDPGIPIPPEATEVHGITSDDLRGEPSFERCAASLLELLEDCDLAGFNLRRFDLPLLQAEFERIGLRLDHRGRRLIDLQSIFHREEPRNLEAAVFYYLGRPHAGAHGAEADTAVLPEILAAQVERYGLPEDLDELHAYLDETHPFETEIDRWWDTSKPNRREWVFRRSKHTGRTLGDVAANESGFLNWMAYKADDMHEDVREVVRLALQGRFE